MQLRNVSREGEFALWFEFRRKRGDILVVRYVAILSDVYSNFVIDLAVCNHENFRPFTFHASSSFICAESRENQSSLVN